MRSRLSLALAFLAVAVPAMAKPLANWSQSDSVRLTRRNSLGAVIVVPNARIAWRYALADSIHREARRRGDMDGSIVNVSERMEQECIAGWDSSFIMTGYGLRDTTLRYGKRYWSKCIAIGFFGVIEVVDNFGNVYRIEHRDSVYTIPKRVLRVLP